MAETIASWANTRPEPEAREACLYAVFLPSGQICAIVWPGEKDDSFYPDRLLTPLYTTPPDDEARRLLRKIRGLSRIDSDLHREIEAYLAQTDGKGE